MKKFLVPLIMAGFIILLPQCTKDDTLEDQLGPLNTQVRVQVAYDDTDIAFRYVWKSQKKKFPAGHGNVGKNYPMHYHDMMQHNGTRFDRLPEGKRMDEDRVTMMINKFENGISGFARLGCAISCHTGMANHKLLSNDILDHWHWRAGRSSPMGYAEDAGVNNVERIRDNLGTPPSKFLRSAGDRLREDQGAMSGTAHPVLVDGFPRFVFNKGKKLGDNYTVSSYFLDDENKMIIRDPYLGLPLMFDLSVNRSLIVVYQDKNFDKIDKVNALDLGYLVWVATNEVNHLPAHLRDVNSADFNTWKNMCAAETGITTASAALAKLNDVHAEWVNSGKKAMVTRSVGFIYPSDQHDITSTRKYDKNRHEWTVVMRRKLRTGSPNDEDLSGINNGVNYTLCFAMHDAGGGSETHDMSIPLILSKNPGFDIQAAKVSSLDNVNWNVVPTHDTYWVRKEAVNHFYYDWLKSSAHPGAGVLTTSSCGNCHNKNSNNLLTTTIVN
jgi:hypothetical protein